MGDTRQFFNVVRDDDARDAESFVHLPDQLQDHAHRNGIEPHEGLVIDQQLRDPSRLPAPAPHGATMPPESSAGIS